MQINKRKLLIWAAAGGLAFLVTAAWMAHRYSKTLDMADIRAAIAARHIKQPDQRLERFLEARYGPLTDPANRQKVFLHFFDASHNKTLLIIMKHTPIEQRKTNVLATARWIANYRKKMSPEEAASLRASLSSPAGQAMVHQATAQYLSQGAEYREMTAPVVSELLTTLKSLKNQ